MALYDSIALYDSGVLYDDTSSPQPTRKKMAKVKLGLSRLTPDELVDLANTIKTAMRRTRKQLSLFLQPEESCTFGGAY